MTTPKKGDHVYVFQNYDRNGTCSYTECIVDSWGKKHAHLRKLDKAMTKQRFPMFYMRRDTTPVEYRFSQVPVILLKSEVADPAAIALTLGTQFAAMQRAWLDDNLERNANDEHMKSLYKDLHEPRALDRTAQP